MKQVTITWARGGTDTFEADKVYTEFVQWKLVLADAIMLIPMRNVKTLLIVPMHGKD